MTTKAKSFQETIHSNPIDTFKYHQKLVFDFTPMQDSTRKILYPKLDGEPLKLELKFTSPLDDVTELIVLGDRISSIAVDKFGVVRKNIKNG